MKRKQVMTKIAAVALAAMMTATVVPAAAVPASAATKVDADQTNDTTYTVTGVDISDTATFASNTKAADVKEALWNEVVDILTKDEDTTGFTAPDVDDVTLTLGTPSASTLAEDGTVNYGTVNGVFTWLVGKSGRTINFTASLNSLTDQEEVNIAKELVEKYAKKEYKASEGVNDVLIKLDAQNVLSKYGAKIYVDDVTVGTVKVTSQTESTETTKGSITATVELNKASTDSNGKATTLKSTATVTATIGTTYKELSDTVANNVVTAINDHTYYNDVTADDVEKVAEASLASQGVKDTTVTVTLKRGNAGYKAATHGDNGEGTLPYLIDFTQGEKSIDVDASLRLIHSPSEVISEAKSTLADVVEDYNKDLANGDVTAPTDKDEAVNTTIPTIISKALATEIKDSDNNSLGNLSTDFDTNDTDDITVEAKDVTYTAPTKDTEGSVKATVTIKVYNGLISSSDGTKNPDSDSDQYTTDTYTFTLTLPKKGTIAAKKLELGNAITIYVTSEGALKTTSWKISDLNKGNRGYEVKPEGANDIEWTSDNDDIQVTDGVITASKLGTATITAKPEKKGLTDSVKVTIAIPEKLFTDVADDTKYYFNPIYDAKEAGVVSGKSEKIFDPKGDTTRAEMVYMLYKCYLKQYGKEDEDIVATESFTDVKDGAYYQKAVAWAQAYGITSGTSTTTFSPNAKITRGQMVTFLYNYEQKFGNNVYATEEQGKVEFSDVNASAYYATAVKWASNVGVAYGYADGTFRPNNNCSRADAVCFIYRAGDIPTDND